MNKWDGTQRRSSLSAVPLGLLSSPPNSSASSFLTASSLSYFYKQSTKTSRKICNRKQEIFGNFAERVYKGRLNAVKHKLRGATVILREGKLIYRRGQEESSGTVCDWVWERISEWWVSPSHSMARRGRSGGREKGREVGLGGVPLEGRKRCEEWGEGEGREGQG